MSYGGHTPYFPVTGPLAIAPDVTGVTDLDSPTGALRNAWFTGTVTAGAFVTTGGAAPGPATFSQITITQGTIVAQVAGLQQSVTWNNAAVTFTAQTIDVTDTASAATSLLVDWRVGGITKLSVDKSGALTVSGLMTANAGVNIVGVASTTQGVSIGNGYPLYIYDSGSVARRGALLTALNAWMFGDIDLLGYQVLLRGATIRAFDATSFIVGTDPGGPQLLRVGGSGVFSGLLTASAGLTLPTVGLGLTVKSGVNSRIGSAVLVGGTVTVANTSVTANTLILLTVKTDGGTVGNLSYTVIAGTSFAINSSNVLDTSTVNWFLIETS